MKYRAALVPCQNGGMPSPQEPLERLNALLLDCGVLQGRAEGLADALKSLPDHDSQMRADDIGRTEHGCSELHRHNNGHR